jgi:hypothetical protein
MRGIVIFPRIPDRHAACQLATPPPTPRRGY